MKFCTQCGNKNNENGKFCVSCGCNLSEIQTHKQDNNQSEIIDSPIKVKKKKKNNRWVWISVLLGIVLIGIYGIYEESLYPKNKIELESLLCNKFWKMKKYTIKEIYVDDILVPEPTQNVRKNLEKAISDNPIYEYSSMYSMDLLEDYKNKDDYINFSSSNGNLWYFSKSFDKSISDYNITHTIISINQTSGKFLLNIPPGLEFRNDNDELYVNDIERIKYNMIIDKITSNSLHTTEDLTSKISGKKIRMVISIVYSPYTPVDKKRYEETQNDNTSEDNEGDILIEPSKVTPVDSF